MILSRKARSIESESHQGQTLALRWRRFCRSSFHVHTSVESTSDGTSRTFRYLPSLMLPARSYQSARLRALTLNTRRPSLATAATRLQWTCRNLGTRQRTNNTRRVVLGRASMPRSYLEPKAPHTLPFGMGTFGKSGIFDGAISTGSASFGSVLVQTANPTQSDCGFVTRTRHETVTGYQTRNHSRTSRHH